MGLFEWLLGEEPNPISQILNYENKGQFGEYLTEYCLNKVKGYKEVLKNLYLPLSNGKTTEIDLIMINSKGIFVFESKNYGGWIFGSEDQKNWTQVFPNKEKYRFYNPIMQNRTHINVISRITKLNKENMFSFIIFSKRCELKKVPNNTDEFTILKRENLIDELDLVMRKKKEIFSVEQIKEITAKLKKYTEVSDEVKRKHIEDIKSR